MFTFARGVCACSTLRMYAKLSNQQTHSERGAQISSSSLLRTLLPARKRLEGSAGPPIEDRKKKRGLANRDERPTEEGRANRALFIEFMNEVYQFK